jgi:hypothetical protein
MVEALQLSGTSVQDLLAEYPRLGEDPDYKLTSEADDRYNCVAWVRRDKGHWIDPEVFWPTDLAPEPPEWEDDLPYYLALFEAWDFEMVESSDREDGYLKIAVFASGGDFDHVAKQLPSGRWSSKGGASFDFRHGTPASVSKCIWRPDMELVAVMRRPYDGIERYEVEESGLIL